MHNTAAMMPKQLGKYRIDEVIGSGGMGIVYRGFDPDIQREVAIKTLHAGEQEAEAAGVSMIDRFRNEAQAAGRLQHPGIVAVYDFGREGGTAFIAMEYVPGHTLSRYMAQVASGQLSIAADDVLTILGQLLEALHHAHEQGVWHRDIKPANLIMTRQGKVKISDFGIARIASAQLTRIASAMGTPQYMAPEQFHGRDIDRRVDLYAAGVVLYQLLTGRAPLSGTPEQLMYKVLHEPITPPSQLPGLAHLAPYDAVLERALAKEPAQRYADAPAFLAALVDAAGRAPSQAVSEATLTAILPGRHRPGAPTAPSAASAPSLPSHFNPVELSQAEAALAKHLGPMARVMVRRAARESRDLPDLYARLASQVTDAGARQLLQQWQLQQPSTSGRSGMLLTPPAGPAATGGTAFAATQREPRTAGLVSDLAAADPLVSPALQAAAQRLLALQLGPIAAVVVKRALAAAPRRQGFLARLCEAVSDPSQRAALAQALAALPD